MANASETLHLLPPYLCEQQAPLASGVIPHFNVDCGTFKRSTLLIISSGGKQALLRPPSHGSGCVCVGVCVCGGGWVWALWGMCVWVGWCVVCVCVGSGVCVVARVCVYVCVCVFV